MYKQKETFRAAKKFYYRPMSSSNKSKSANQFDQIKVCKIQVNQSLTKHENL